jgi:hypothetical protein
MFERALRVVWIPVLFLVLGTATAAADGPFKFQQTLEPELVCHAPEAAVTGADSACRRTPVPVPTLSAWGNLMLMLVLLSVGAYRIRFGTERA